MSHVAAASPAPANDITPGVLGFLVIAGMAVVLFFLLRSMNMRLKRVRAVRDAGLPPGSELPAAPRGKPANGAGQAGRTPQAGAAANGSRGQPAAGAAATGSSADSGAQSDVAADPADPAGGAAGG
jgi:hypothetical protein